LSVVFRPKILSLQIHIITFTFFENPEKQLFTFFLLCFTRFLELWLRECGLQTISGAVLLQLLSYGYFK